MADSTITKLTALEITGDPHSNINGFFVPQLSNAQRDSLPSNIIKDGMLHYNTDAQRLETREHGQWYVINVSVPTPSNAPGIHGAPLILPTGARVDVEVPANEIIGFMYYDTSSNTVRVRTAVEWVGA